MWQGINQGADFLVIDPVATTTLYAGTYSGIFKSTDGGGSWHAVNAGLGQSVFTLAIDPVTTTTLYAGTRVGIFKTIDGGSSWMAMNSGLDAETLADGLATLVIDPMTPSTLYTSGYTIGGFGVNTGVYKSTNGAESWRASNNGLRATTVRTQVIDPITPTTLYVLAGALFKTTDAGVSWVRFAGTCQPYTDSTRLTIDPADADHALFL